VAVLGDSGEEGDALPEEGLLAVLAEVQLSARIFMSGRLYDILNHRL
jgi:hypothetical protein